MEAIIIDIITIIKEQLQASSEQLFHRLTELKALARW
jgi:hypothetical protein